MFKRVLADLILFAAALLFPWWLPAMLGCVGLFLFTNFYEIVGVGIILDALYGMPGSGVFTLPLWYTSGGLLLFVLVHLLKKRLKFYS